MISQQDMFNYDKVLNILIEHFIDMGNSVAGKSYPTDNLLRFGEPLAIKTINHIVSIQKLCQPDSFLHSKIELQKVIDYSSIAVLTRAAFETYLTFNHIFVAPKTYEEKELRYYCWDIAGIIEREDFPATTVESINTMDNEKNEKIILFEKLEKNPLYKKISAEGKKRLKNGNWRIFKTWRDLSRESGITEQYFNVIYSYLSSYCHSGRLSVIQIEQSRDLKTQKELSETLLQINTVILSHLIHDYILFLPDCNIAHEKDEEAVFLTNLYYQVGNRFNF